MHNDQCMLGRVDIPEIERDLVEKQAEFKEGTRRLRLARKEAVKRAQAAGLTKYRIAAVMGVKGPTVDSIIASAEPDDS